MWLGGLDGLGLAFLASHGRYLFDSSGVARSVGGELRGDVVTKEATNAMQWRPHLTLSLLD